MSENPAKGVAWNLADLYDSPDNPRLKADLKAAETKALRFEQKYKRPMEKLARHKTQRASARQKTGKLDLPKLLKDYKEIVTLLTKPMVYAHLHFAEKTDDPRRGAFLQKTRTTLTEIQSHTLFWEIYWNLLNAKVVIKGGEIVVDKR